MVWRVVCSVAASAAAVVALSSSSFGGGGTFGSYGLSYRAMTMPANAPGSFRFAGDVLPDGRIIGTTGLTVLVESAVGSGVMQAVATLDGSLVGDATDPAFLRVSSGGRIALGAGLGRPVVVFHSSALGTPAMPGTIGAVDATLFNVAHYEGAWADATHLALTAGDFGAAAYVSLLDTASDPFSPANPRVIDNIGGASAGVAFDRAGRLFTGNGFDDGPGGSATGWIKAFSPSDWAMGAVDFEGAGTLIGDVLSAGSLAFDHEGNLFVGGGDFGAGDTGYLGVVSAGAVAGALGGGGPIDPLDPGQLRRLDPRGDPFAFYGGVYNPMTGEVYVGYGDFASGANTWYGTVPGPGSAVVVAVAVVWVGRRRRG